MPDAPEDDYSFEASEPVKPKQEPALAGEEIELEYLSAVLGDPDGMLFSRGQSLPVSAFGNPEARKLWKALRDGIKVDDVLGLVKESGVSLARIMQFGELDRSGVMAPIRLAELWRRHRLRLKGQLAKRIEQAEEIDPDEWKKLIDAIAAGEESANDSRPLTTFRIPPDGDRSILLGNRYLNRGDSGVIVSTSGVGKSSMSLQAAVCWALKMDFFGIKPNGALVSLVVQAEDSEGDLAEVWESIVHEMQLTPEQVAIVQRRVIIVTDRTHRGAGFINYLRLLIAKHKPDLVWINPLQAFIDGDVTDAKDLGAFLREGLNGLNQNAQFGTIVVHHTTKPPAPSSNTGERSWSEVMYDMAGGAEIINWARFIISLRATEVEGSFNLVLAKRGRRAGITKQVEQGAGFRDEIVTSVAVKHASGFFRPTGANREIPVIFWEPADHNPKAPVRRNVDPYDHKPENLLALLTHEEEKAPSFQEILRAAKGIGFPVSLVPRSLAQLTAENKTKKIGPEAEPRYYRLV